MPEISVIILTYNSASYIEKLLKSLFSVYEKEIEGKSLEIIVSDNSSSDNTLAIASKFKNVKAIENGDNLGFAKGINFAAKSASGKCLLLINPDAVFVKGDIFELAQNLDEKVVVVGGEIIGLDGKKELSCGKFYNFLNVLFMALGLEQKLGIRFSPKEDKFVDYVSGGFFMIKKDIFDSMHGFDENLFMYVEDMEFCFRVKKKNLKVLFSNLATIQHVGQGSSNRSFAVVNIYKGILYFHKKHMSALSFALVKIMLTLKAVSLVIVGRISNNKYLYSTYSQVIR